MTSVKPYLIRAWYEWMVDSDLSPHVLVKATGPGVAVPQEYIKDGQIVLCIDADAIDNLILNDNHQISFTASFNGIIHHCRFPVANVRAIYASENGKGTMFPEEDDGPPSDDENNQSEGPSGRVMKVVK